MKTTTPPTKCPVHPTITLVATCGVAACGLCYLATLTTLPPAPPARPVYTYRGPHGHMVTRGKPPKKA